MLSPDADDNEKQQLFDCVKSATNLNSPLVIMGDFNYPGADWKQLKADDATGTKFVKLIAFWSSMYTRLQGEIIY